MSSRLPPRLRTLLGMLVALVVWSIPRPAAAWIENHVLGDDVRIALERSGKAVVEHRLTLHTNGSERLRGYRLEGLARDAEPLPDSYVVPASDALSSSLASATPVILEVEPGDGEGLAALSLRIDDRKGLRRGTYVFVLRYRTDLLATGQVARDGAMARVTWDGPVFDDGFDNARTTFVVPAAPSAPRPVSEAQAHEGDDTLPATYFSELRRGSEHDELELLRTYAPKQESIRWAIRVDARALDATARQEIAPPETPAFSAVSARLASRDLQIGVGAGLFALVALLGWWRSREVAALSQAAGAETPPIVPFPGWLRAILAAAAMVAGVGLQLVWVRPIAGALCVLAACVLVAHGASRPLPAQLRRGPGRWLTVTEREAFGPTPRLRGAWLDTSTRAGKLVVLVLLGLWGAASAWLAQRALSLGILLGFDAVVLLAIAGTGRMAGLPPDMAVEPVAFLRRLAAALRKRRGLEGMRLVPRIRIPQGEVDPDELRLWVVPKLPMRGFSAIEIGVTYALGFGARVAMPEVLLRVVADSPCDEAVAAVSRKGRITPGRKPDERVIAFAPRLPTVRMTAEIAAALAMRVVDREALRRAAEPPPPPQAEPKKRRTRRPKKAPAEAPQHDAA